MLGASFLGRRARVAAVFAALALTPAPAAAQAATCEDPAVLRFALAAGGKPAQQLKLYLPLLDLLAAVTGKPVDVLLPGSEASAVAALEGGAHLAVLSAALYLEARAGNSGVAPFAAPARPPGHLQTEAPGPEVVLISGLGSGIKKLRAARGTVAGLADRESLLGYQVPAVIFAEQVGEDLASYFSRLEFTGDDDDSIEAVVEGRLDVAFVEARQFDQEVDKAKLRLEDVTLLWRSPPLPADPLVFGAGLCEDLRKTIAETVLDLHSRFEIRAFLDRLKAPRMLPVTDADYQILRDLRAAEADEGLVDAAQ